MKIITNDFFTIRKKVWFNNKFALYSYLKISNFKQVNILMYAVYLLHIRLVFRFCLLKRKFFDAIITHIVDKTVSYHFKIVKKNSKNKKHSRKKKTK